MEAWTPEASSGVTLGQRAVRWQRAATYPAQLQSLPPLHVMSQRKSPSPFGPGLCGVGGEGGGVPITAGG